MKCSKNLLQARFDCSKYCRGCGTWISRNTQLSQRKGGALPDMQPYITMVPPWNSYTELDLLYVLQVLSAKFEIKGNYLLKKKVE